MTILGQDDLLEIINSVPLSSHTPSGSGGTWIQGVDNNYGAIVSSANIGFVGVAGFASTAFLSDSAGPSPDYVQCILNITSTGKYSGIAFCFDSHGSSGNGGSNYIFGFINNAWQLMLDGGATILSTISASFTPNYDYLLRLQRIVVSGVSHLTPYIDGVAYPTVTDSTYIGDLKGGIYGYDATNTRWKNFETGTLVSAPGALSLTSKSPVSLSLSDFIDGVSPFSNQLKRSISGANTYSNVGSPVIGLNATFTDNTAAASTKYDYKVVITDGNSSTFTTNAITVGTLTLYSDSNILFTGRWHNGITISNGSQVEIAFNGDTCILNFDVSGITDYPVIAYWADGIGPTRIQLSSTGKITPTLQGTNKLHYIKFMANLFSGYPSTIDNWNSQAGALKFTSVDLNANGTLVIPNTLSLVEFDGDSITAGMRIQFTSNWVNDDRVEVSWTQYVAQLLGIRPIVNGHGGQGITTTSTDDSPIANSAFPYVYNGVPWTTQPVAAVLFEGTNDSSFTANQYQTYLSTVRSTYPTAIILAICPKTALSTNMQTAVNNLNDSKIYFRDYSSAFLSSDYSDGIHLNESGSIKMGLKVANDLKSLLTVQQTNSSIAY